MCIEASARTSAAAACILVFAAAAAAQPATLKPDLVGLAFLIGTWSGGNGQVVDTGGTASGSSSFEAAANGSVILRRDHTDLFDRSGKPTGGFDQIMMIYPEAGTLHADYSDGTHVIHYVSAAVVPGKSAAFTSAKAPGAPVFRLAYTYTAPATLAVSFSVSPPGSATFRPIATGSLSKSPS